MDCWHTQTSMRKENWCVCMCVCVCVQQCTQYIYVICQPCACPWCVQIDHCEERSADLDSFWGVADKTAGTVDQITLQTFFCIVSGSTKRHYKQRLSMNEV